MQPQSKQISVSSTLPVENPGNAEIELYGAMGVSFDCTAASTGNCLMEVQFRPGGSWRPWPCWEFASAAGTFTARIPGATIALAAADVIFAMVPTCFKARLKLTGTSFTVNVQTGEDIDALVTYLATVPSSSGESDPTLISIRVLDSDGAQANIAMVTASSGTIIGVKRYSIKMDGSNTGPINATLGFAAATLATPNTTTGAGILEDFLGVSAGQGVAMGDGGSILGWGASGEDLRYTMEDPAGGAGTITVTYVTKAG